MHILYVWYAPMLSLLIKNYDNIYSWISHKVEDYSNKQNAKM